MNMPEIAEFLRILGVKNMQQDEDRGWVRASCPLAPWQHEGGRDRKPSFGIKMPEQEGEVPYYHCCTCQAKGSLPTLVTLLMRLSGNRMTKASKYLSQFLFFKNDEEEVSGRRRIVLHDRFVDTRFTEREVRRNVPVPPEVLAQFPPLYEKCDLNAHREALLWLGKERGISVAAMRKYQVRLYVSPLDEVGVLFPIIDRDGETVLDMWARLIDSQQFFRVTRSLSRSPLDYKAPNLLFGNHLFEPGRPIILVEGAMDALKLESLGVHRAMASMGALSTEQAESLPASAVFLGYGSDAASRKFANRARKKLGNVPSVYLLDWSLAGCMDVGELATEDQLKKVYAARIKIVDAPKVQERVIQNKPRAKLHVYKDDGTFLLMICFRP